MSAVKEAIIEELQELLPKSKHYADQLETAKTKLKKDMMKKRLRKNNQKVADLLIALERIKKEAEDGSNNPERGTTEESSAEKSAD